MFKDAISAKHVYLPAIFAFIVSIAIISENLYVNAIVLGVGLSAIVFLNSEISIWIILLNVYLFSSLITMYFPSVGRRSMWVTDIIALAVLLKFFLKLRAFREPVITKEITLILSLIFIGIMSAVINGVSFFTIIGGLRNYFKYVPIFLYFKYFDYKDDFIHYLMRFFLIISALNVFISIFQFFVYREADYIGGLFGLYNSGVMSVFQIAMATYLAASLKLTKKNRIPVILLIFFILIPIFINETKVSFILLPVTVSYFYKERFFRKPFEFIGILSTVTVILLLLASSYGHLVKNFNPKEMITKKYIYSYFYDPTYFKGGRSLNRLSALEFAYKNISQNPVTLLVGIGVGDASYSDLPEVMGAVYKKYFNLKIDFIFLSRILFEYGLIGTGLFFILIFVLWRRSVFLIHRASNDYTNVISFLFGFLCIALSLTTVYDFSFYNDQLGCFFWILAGFVSRKAQG